MSRTNTCVRCVWRRLARNLRSMRMISHTLYFAAPSLVNFALLMAIVGYVWAMLAMTLLGGATWSGGTKLSVHAK